MQVGDMVMVRDPYIQREHHIPQAEIVEVKDDAVLLRKTYLLRFENGVTEWFDSWALKTE